MGTRGTIIWLDNDKGDCSYIQEINGDMGPDFGRGPLAISLFETAKTRKQFVEKGLQILCDVGYVNKDDLTEEDRDAEMWIKRGNLITRGFHNIKKKGQVGTYYQNWNSDYLYVINMTGKDFETKDYDGKPAKIENGYINIFDFGKFHGKIPIVTEKEEKTDMKKTTVKKAAKEYEPPVITLKEAVKEYDIKITKDDLTVVDSLQTILTSGVDEVTLSYDKKHDAATVKGNYKSVTCTNVKVKKISNKGNMNENISDTKAHIECSHWMFPCPDYKYSNIKRNLERAICAILEIGTCEVASFSTDIVEFEDANRK